MRKLPVPVPEDTYERLLALARSERRSPSAQALVLIERGLRRGLDIETVSLGEATSGRPR